jgi:hypothetical protein
MRKGRLVVALLVTGLVLTGIGVAGVWATCFRRGDLVERVLQYRSTYGGGNSYIYFRPRTALTNSVYYYCRVLLNEANGPELLAVAASAKSNRVEVNALGDRSSCPTSGTGRFMGECNYIYMLN